MVETTLPGVFSDQILAIVIVRSTQQLNNTYIGVAYVPFNFTLVINILK